MVKYLKKKKLYELLKKLTEEGQEIPLCKYFRYRYFHGCERLEGDGYQISSMGCGMWVQIEQITFDEDNAGNDVCHVKRDTFSKYDKTTGQYNYHSCWNYVKNI